MDYLNQFLKSSQQIKVCLLFSCLNIQCLLTSFVTSFGTISFVMILLRAPSNCVIHKNILLLLSLEIHIN